MSEEQALGEMNFGSHFRRNRGGNIHLLTRGFDMRMYLLCVIEGGGEVVHLSREEKVLPVHGSFVETQKVEPSEREYAPFKGAFCFKS